MQEITVTMPWGEELRLQVDLTQASAPILYEGAEEFEHTPFQTADARHLDLEAVMLVVEWLGQGWYRAPDDERDAAELLSEIRDHVREQL